VLGNISRVSLDQDHLECPLAMPATDYSRNFFRKQDKEDNLFDANKGRSYEEILNQYSLIPKTKCKKKI
jgi:hypothetical protein